MQPITVVIPTKNEASVIARAIGSVRWADEIIVVDSESTDATVDIAASLGARVIIQPWLGWIDQKMVGVNAARNDWIFWIDADEIVTPALQDSIREQMRSNPDPRNGFVVNRAEEFLGELMPNMRRRAKRINFIRLFNRRHGHWNPRLIVHEEIEVPGERIMLAGDLIHWRNYSIGRQMETLNRNAELESSLIRDSRSRHGIVLSMLTMPVLRFCWIYFICSGWTKGVRGLIWAGLHSVAEFLRYAKAWESIATTPSVDPPTSIKS